MSEAEIATKNQRIAELETELAECEKIISDLNAQLTEEADTRLVCAGCGFFIEPDIRWGRDRHAYHAKCLPADGRTYAEGCAP